MRIESVVGMYPRLSVAVVLVAASAWGQGVPGMAVGILEHAAQAREAVSRRDQAAALQHIRDASTLASNIKEQSPGSAPVLVPVAAETSTTKTWSPVKGKKDGEMSARRLKHNTSVREVEQTTTTSLLDVSSAAERLSAAASAIESGDWSTADSSLAAIPQSVIRSQSDGHMPLLKARENLQLARARVLEEKYKDAEAPLRAAADALAAYARISRGPQAEQAQAMRTAIEALAKEIGSRHDGALERIDSWLDPVTQWNQAIER